MEYASGTSTEMLAKWTAEIQAMPEKKRKKWKGALYDKWNVRQQVRYAGPGHFLGDVPYLGLSLGGLQAAEPPGRWALVACR